MIGPQYAKETTVSVERSRGEIESLLRRYGASGFGYMWQGNAAVVVFEMGTTADEGPRYRVRFTLPLPSREDDKYHKTPGRGLRRSHDQAFEAWEQDCRSRWRSLTLCIKAKLESVASSIETFEEAFLPHIVLPDNSTVGDFMVPQLALAYQTRKMPPLLPAAGGKK